MSISLRDDILIAVKGAQTPEFRKPVAPPPPQISRSNAAKPCLIQGLNPLTMQCIYSTPCGWCAKWDKKCDKKIGCKEY